MLPVLAPHVLEEVVLGRDRPPSAPGGRHLAGGVLALPHGRAPRDLLDLVVQGPAVEGEAEDLRKVQLALGPEPVACARKATPGVGVEHRPARASAPVHVVGHRGQVDVRRGEDVADEERPVHGAAGAPVGADGLPIARQPRPYLCQRLGDGPGRANRPGPSPRRWHRYGRGWRAIGSPSAPTGAPAAPWTGRSSSATSSPRRTSTCPRWPTTWTGADARAGRCSTPTPGVAFRARATGSGPSASWISRRSSASPSTAGPWTTRSRRSRGARPRGRARTPPAR